MDCCQHSHIIINPLVPEFILKWSQFIGCRRFGDAGHEWVNVRVRRSVRIVISGFHGNMIGSWYRDQSGTAVMDPRYRDGSDPG